MKADQILKAGADILTSRAKEYDPEAKEERNMARIVRVFNAFHDLGMSESQGWHFMQILKEVRAFGAPEFHKDSAIDGVNYGALMSEALATEQAAALAGLERGRFSSPEGWAFSLINGGYTVRAWIAGAKLPPSDLSIEVIRDYLHEEVALSIMRAIEAHGSGWAQSIARGYIDERKFVAHPERAPD